MKSFLILNFLAMLAMSQTRKIPISQLPSQSTSQQPVAVQAALGESRIIGGDEVVQGFAPYQVSIQNTFGEHVCGGSIVNKEWILTAAHCMDWPIQYLKVVTGTVNWTKPDAEYTISEAKVHCLYNKPYYSNDIALLKLSKRIVYNDKTKAVKLAKRNSLNDGDKLLLTGWGSVKLWGHSPEILHKVELKYLDHNKCVSAVRRRNDVHIGHICSFTKTGEGSCQGDSGGPLVDANQVQVGIVNWGEPCAVGYPDVYASVAYYHDWITSTMAGKSNTC